MPEPIDISTAIQRRYVPVAVLAVYQLSKKREIACREDGMSAYYLETRPVLADGTTGAARPVSRKFIGEIARTFKAEGEHTPHGPLPERLLYADSRLGFRKYVWWTPPGVRTLYFSKGLGMKDGPYHMPGTVYRLENGTLYVYAFRGKAPKRKARLLYGPFFNYDENHSMCLGSAKAELPEDPTWEDVLRHAETLFWNSVNSHTTVNPMKRGENLTVALKDAIDKPFDTSLLRESSATLESLLR